jgi:hypothetical protein
LVQFRPWETEQPVEKGTERIGFEEVIMKKGRLFWVALIAIFILAPGMAIAGPTLQWEPSTGEVSGYKVLFGTAATELTEEKDVGNTTRYSLNNLPLKDSTTYYFAVRAYNAQGESPDSNQISWTSSDSTPPMPPQGVTVE